MNKLILIEGIPGSGKTTLSAKVKDYLISKGYKVLLFYEGDSHPVDLAWIASVPIDEYNDLLIQNPQLKGIIQENTKVDKDYAYVAYTQLGMYPQENELMKYFEDHEVYNARVSLETFQKLHMNRWKEYSNISHEETITIFECAYLQNHVNEMLAYHNKDVEYISQYMCDLISTVKNLKPKLIYLSQDDVRETITRVSKDRIAKDRSKGRDWIDLVIDYIENCPYGIKHQLKGFEGVIEYFENRQQIEQKIFEDLTIDKVIIHNKDFNWKKILYEVLNNI